MPAPIVSHFKNALRALDRFSTALTRQEKYLTTQKLFRNLFYAWLSVHTILLLPFHREVWGPEAFVQRLPFDSHSLYDWIFHLAAHQKIQNYYLIFVLAQLSLMVVAVISGVAPRLFNSLICAITINLNNLTPVIVDGGTNLAQLILLYMLLLNTSGKPVRVTWLPLRMGLTAVSNAAFFLCRLQVVIVYLCSAILKLSGPLWQSGMALYYIFQTDSYTHPLLYRLIRTYPLLSLVGSYFTLAFEALFPLLVWFRKTRATMLLLGVVLHLGISFGMGLFTFGVVMCVMYTLFLTDETSRGIVHFFSLQDRLYVIANPRVRIQWLLGWLKRLDWGGALDFPTATDVDRSSLHSRDFSLIAIDATNGVMYEDVYALWRITAKLPVLLPLLPVFGLLGYVGFAQLLYRFLFRSSGRSSLMTEDIPEFNRQPDRAPDRRMR